MNNHLNLTITKPKLHNIKKNMRMKNYYTRLGFLFCYFVLFSVCLNAQDTLGIASVPQQDTIYEITFQSGNRIQGKIVREDINRLQVHYLSDTITILRSNLKHIATYRRLGNIELTTIIFPKNHPEYGVELARDAPPPKPAIKIQAQEPEYQGPTIYEVELKSGSKLIGEIIRETSELLLLKVGKNEMLIRSKDIRIIRTVVKGKETGMAPQRFMPSGKSNHYNMSYTPTAFRYKKGERIFEGIAAFADGYPFLWSSFEGGFSDHLSGRIGLVLPGVVTTRLKLGFGENKVRGAVAWEGFIIPFDGVELVNIFRGILSAGSPKAFANFSYGRIVGIDDEQDMFSFGGGFDLGEKVSVNIEWIILRDKYNGYTDTNHVILPRFDYVSKRNRFGLTPTFVPGTDINPVILFFTYVRTLGKNK